MMCGVHGRLLVWLLLLAPPLSVVVPVSATPVPRKVRSPVSAEELAPTIGYVIHRPPVEVTSATPSPVPDSAGNEAQKDADPDPEPGCETAARPKRRTPANSDSRKTVWQWLKGNDEPEDNCLLMAIGGVAGGGALTGAFVGAGIGSIFTGPGAIVGGIVGGLVGMFGGLSVGTRAGAVACDSSS
uniref:Glycine zipper domain-containing protein n=1 Tax=Anopheles albimanus TaxID=7167 RepID=A0A182FU01_ANOAL